MIPPSDYQIPHPQTWIISLSKSKSGMGVSLDHCGNNWNPKPKIHKFKTCWNIKFQIYTCWILFNVNTKIATMRFETQIMVCLCFFFSKDKYVNHCIHIQKRGLKAYPRLDNPTPQTFFSCLKRCCAASPRWCKRHQTVCLFCMWFLGVEIYSTGPKPGRWK